MTNKIRKRRKPMTKEQRAAAAERLAKARAAKGASKNLSLHQALERCQTTTPSLQQKSKSG